MTLTAGPGQETTEPNDMPVPQPTLNVIIKHLDQLRKDSNGIRRAFSEGVAAASFGVDQSPYHADDEADQDWAFRAGLSLGKAQFELEEQARETLRAERARARLELLLSARQLGEVAGQQGQPYGANPYPPQDTELYSAWANGWRMAYLMDRVAELRRCVSDLGQVADIVGNLSLVRLAEAMGGAGLQVLSAVHPVPPSAEELLQRLAALDQQRTRALEEAPDALITRFVLLWETLNDASNAEPAAARMGPADT